MDLFRNIRVNARNNQKEIISFLKENYLDRENGKAKAVPLNPICLFCSSDKNLTKEHILPKWVFERKPNKTFLTTINGLSHKYNQTTLSACSTCNNSLLSKIEKRVLKIFTQHNLPTEYFKLDELTDIIRWMQLLDYKFQAFSLITRFRAVAGQGSTAFLRDYPLSVLDPNVEYSPVKVLQNLRRSFKRIIVKSKIENLNSLVIFKTSNPDIHFFHKNNDFLFLELPRYNIAIIYFYELLFSNAISARNYALELIHQNYDQ